jgi:hypothetical protein
MDAVTQEALEIILADQEFWNKEMTTPNYAKVEKAVYAYREKKFLWTEVTMNIKYNEVMLALLTGNRVYVKIPRRLVSQGRVLLISLLDSKGIRYKCFPGGMRVGEGSLIFCVKKVPPSAQYILELSEEVLKKYAKCNRTGDSPVHQETKRNWGRPPKGE